MRSLGIETLIYIGTGVLVATVLVLVVAMVLRHHRRATLGPPEVRRKRERAVVSSPIQLGSPFELRGAAPAGRLTVFLDLDVTVPMARGMANLDNLGVDLSFEVAVDGEVIATRRTQMPARCPRANEHFRSETHSEKRIRHVCHVHAFDVARDAELTLRGAANPVGPTTANRLVIWVG
jgi:hypothetical protein